MVDLCLALEVYLVLYGFCAVVFCTVGFLEEEHPEKNVLNENKAIISMNGRNRFILPQCIEGKRPLVSRYLLSLFLTLYLLDGAWC